MAPVEVRPLPGLLGAELWGLDLRHPDPGLEAVQRAFLDHHVLVFRDQRWSPEEQLAFARRLGEPEVHPNVEGSADHPELIRVRKPAGEAASFGVGWHADNTFFPRPSMATLLYGKVVPPRGGDTLFADMEAAYRALPPTLQERLRGLHGVHSARRAYDPAVTGEAKYRGGAALRYHWSEAIRSEVRHPVVRTHPQTGRPCLFVNPMFTLRIHELDEGEGHALLQQLFAHASQPRFTVRVHWEPGTVVLWDNRCVWHQALDDCREFERLMFRVTLAGDVPF